mmetsp:Transcript_6140/g.11567  ORF Transcript_6140/g.11567 Transcript_6140/m.11567 type:complete len:258 (+) Transcript_6140:1513-2286(+)
MRRLNTNRPDFEIRVSSLSTLYIALSVMINTRFCSLPFRLTLVTNAENCKTSSWDVLSPCCRSIILILLSFSSSKKSILGSFGFDRMPSIESMSIGFTLKLTLELPLELSFSFLSPEIRFLPCLSIATSPLPSTRFSRIFSSSSLSFFSDAIVGVFVNCAALIFGVTVSAVPSSVNSRRFRFEYIRVRGGKTLPRLGIDRDGDITFSNFFHMSKSSSKVALCLCEVSSSFALGSCAVFPIIAAGLKTSARDTPPFHG